MHIGNLNKQTYFIPNMTSPFDCNASLNWFKFAASVCRLRFFHYMKRDRA